MKIEFLFSHNIFGYRVLKLQYNIIYSYNIFVIFLQQHNIDHPHSRKSKDEQRTWAIISISTTYLARHDLLGLGQQDFTYICSDLMRPKGPPGVRTTTTTRTHLCIIIHLSESDGKVTLCISDRFAFSRCSCVQVNYRQTINPWADLYHPLPATVPRGWSKLLFDEKNTLVLRK